MNRSDTTPRSFSASQLRTALGDVGGSARPGYLTDIVAQAGRTRQRHAWTFPGRWVPVDMAVGRQGLPRAAVMLIVLSLLVALLVAGTVYVGSRTRPAPLPTEPGAWSRVVIETPSGAGSVVSLAAGPQGLLAVIETDDGPAELFASTDGRSWSRVPPDEHPAFGTDGAGWALVGSDRGFLLSNGDVWSSKDGFEWQLLASEAEDPDLGHGEMLGVAAGGPGYVAVGNGNSAWYSTDGSDWSLAKVPPPPTQFFESQGFAAPEVDMRGIAVAGDTLFAWGSAGQHTEDSGLGVPVIWTSQDGRSWTNLIEPSDGDGSSAMAVGPGGLAAVFDDNAQLVVRLSADGDGTSWEQVGALGAARSHDADGRPLDLDVSAIAATDAGFVVAGGRGPRCLMAGVPCGPEEALIWTSRDGRTWTALPSDERFARAGASDVVAWGSRFVVGGTHDGKPVIWISGV